MREGFLRAPHCYLKGRERSWVGSVAPTISITPMIKEENRPTIYHTVGVAVVTGILNPAVTEASCKWGKWAIIAFPRPTIGCGLEWQSGDTCPTVGKNRGVQQREAATCSVPMSNLALPTAKDYKEQLQGYKITQRNS